MYMLTWFHYLVPQPPARALRALPPPPLLLAPLTSTPTSSSQLSSSPPLVVSPLSCKRVQTTGKYTSTPLESDFPMESWSTRRHLDSHSFLCTLVLFQPSSFAMSIIGVCVCVCWDRHPTLNCLRLLFSPGPRSRSCEGRYFNLWMNS